VAGFGHAPPERAAQQSVIGIYAYALSAVAVPSLPAVAMPAGGASGGLVVDLPSSGPWGLPAASEGSSRGLFGPLLPTGLSGPGCRPFRPFPYVPRPIGSGRIRAPAKRHRERFTASRWWSLRPLGSVAAGLRSAGCLAPFAPRFGGPLGGLPPSLDNWYTPYGRQITPNPLWGLAFWWVARGNRGAQIRVAPPPLSHDCRANGSQRLCGP
jgi:hypothetical protein